ncbi:glycoside hydrolase family 1 protein [Patescibacteria group bacterium]
MPETKSKKNYEFKFPKDFLWGSASSAHQVEGGNMFNDWWAWEQQGRILNKQVSNDACNHYEMYKEDFTMMQKMHHNAHRLSIEWSRIEQTEGNFNIHVIEHYKKVLTDLREKGIKPVVTLWHFTLPHWFAKQGGFLNPKGRLIFNRYVKRIVDELGDLVDTWITINEPFVYANFSYYEGTWPPGQKSFFKMLKVLKELLHVHIDAYQIINEVYKERGWRKPMVGFAKSFIWFDPYKRKSILSWILSETYRYLYNKLYFRPFYSGRYPLLLGYRKIHDAKKSLDFIGINYYFRCECRFQIWKNPMHLKLQPSASSEKTLFNWEVFPDGLYYLTKLIHRKLKIPVLITENGISTLDDAQRTSFIIRHLDAINRAMREGAQVMGYLYWSFLDNFEWAEGYTQPFGLVAFNHRTFERIPKTSSQVYSEICKSSCVTDAMVKKYAKNIRDRVLH